MKDFTDKIVVITGGATGIGFSFARRFGGMGAKLVIAARREDRLQEAVAKLHAEGIEAKYCVCDVTRREDFEALADFTWREFGRADVLVNNAGAMQTGKTLLQSTVEDFRAIYDVNVFSIVHGASVFGKRLVEQGTPAAIYNVGSENSLFNGVPTGAAYVSSKHAVLAITESLREDLPEFIDVALICPGFVRSELGPEEQMSFGMDTDRYAALAMEQLQNGEFYIVSHSYNMVRIDERYEKLSKAFARYAPRYEGDDEYDIRTLLKRIGASPS